MLTNEQQVYGAACMLYEGVLEINALDVPEDEVLSDEVYYYDKEKRELLKAE